MVFFCEKIIKQYCAHATQVQTTRRTWGKPDPNFFIRHSCAKIGKVRKSGSPESPKDRKCFWVDILRSESPEDRKSESCFWDDGKGGERQKRPEGRHSANCPGWHIGTGSSQFKQVSPSFQKPPLLYQQNP